MTESGRLPSLDELDARCDQRTVGFQRFSLICSLCTAFRSTVPFHYSKSDMRTGLCKRSIPNGRAQAHVQAHVQLVIARIVSTLVEKIRLARAGVVNRTCELHSCILLRDGMLG